MGFNAGLFEAKLSMKGKNAKVVADHTTTKFLKVQLIESQIVYKHLTRQAG